MFIQKKIQFKHKNDQLLKYVMQAAISVACLLIILKITIWVFSGSISILASSIDSILDLLASIINFFVLKIALKPADSDHHFGHSKAEQLAALAQASFIGGSAVYLIFFSIDRLQTNHILEYSNLAIYAIIISTIITFFLVLFQRYVYQKTQSNLVKTDEMHYKMDILINLGVLLALVLNEYGWKQADPMISIMIAAWMLFNVKSIAWRAIELLMDKALPEQQLASIKSIILKDTEVYGMHTLRTRQVGIDPVIQYHLELSSNLLLSEAYTIGSRVKKNLLQSFPTADITFHMEPVPSKKIKTSYHLN
ncbi:MAG: cation diffusion facilitator family transporter [Endozoicomonadaceae bacterium]|nr:cation diffusion facilitator family transporter [Endozoicomonadaceae bacterium]